MQLTFEQLPEAISRLNDKLDNIEQLLLKEQSEPDKWMSISELMDYLPGKPAKATIYAKVSNRTIPHRKVGKRLAFLKSEINDWMNSQKRKTIDEYAI